MTVSNTFWDTSKPVDGLLIPDIPQVFRNHVTNTAGIIEREHTTLGTAANTGGEHLKGSAVSYAQAGSPTQRPDASTTLTVADTGRSWLDTDDNRFYLLTDGSVPTWTAQPNLALANTWDLAQTFTLTPTWSEALVGKDIYIKAQDQAETGTVNLIRADSNDLSALPDGAVLEAATQSGDGDRTIADKAYIDTSLFRNVDATPTEIFTIYLTGTLDADSETSVAHGLDFDKIVGFSTLAFDDGGDVAYKPSDAVQYVAKVNSTNVVFADVSANTQGNNYRIQIDYTV